MVTSISLGGLSQQNGRTVVTGTASGGLDTQTLIEELTAARRLPAVQLETRIEDNASTIEAFGSLQSILNTLSDAADLLRNPPGVNNEAENIFEYRVAQLSTNTGVSADNFIEIDAQPGAFETTYDITVEQLATRNVKTTETFSLAGGIGAVAVGGGALPFNAGNLLLGASGTSVTLDAGDSLAEVISKVNAVSDISGVEAQLVTVAADEYRISFVTTDTGAATNYDLGIPVAPAFVASDAIFSVDANDINGDGDYTNNPGADQAVGTLVDSTGTTTITANGGGGQLDIDGAPNGDVATLDLSGGGSYTVTNNGAINTGGPYAEKTFAFAFETGANIAGTQVIYEQGGAGRSFSLSIAPDAGNGNAPTLFAVAHNTSEWVGAEQFQILNLGAVTANTSYNVVLDFDATANPSVNDPANTFTAFVNGVQTAQETGLAQMNAHTGAVAIGRADGGYGQANGTTFGGTGQNFQGSISEVTLFNRSLSNSEIGEMSTYLDRKYNLPVSTSPVLNIGLAVEETASDAVMNINGTEIVRSTNTFNDVVDNVTFNLLQETPPGTQVEADVEPDTEVVKAAITAFVDAYNEFRVFQARQNELDDDGLPVDAARLNGNASLRSITSRINQEVSGIVEGITGGDPDRLGLAGVEFFDFDGDAETPFVRNVMRIDEPVLDALLQTDFDAVRRVFEFDFASTNPNLTVFSRSNDLDTTSIDLNIDITNGIYTATYVDGGGPQTINLDVQNLSTGVFLKGQQGTVLEGLELIYASNNDDTMSLSMSQGIGDRLYNDLEEILSSDNGIIQNEIDDLADASTRYGEEITRIDRQIEQYRERLLTQFSVLEQAISTANLLLQQLAAQSNAQLAASN